MDTILKAPISGATRVIDAARAKMGILAALMMALFMAIAPGTSFAQDADFRGLITAINTGAGTLTVNGTSVFTNGSSQFESDTAGPVAFSYFQYGMNVRVRGFTQGDQSVLVDRLDEKEPGSGQLGGGTDRFSGIVESKDSGTGVLVVNGLTIHTTAYTAYESEQGVVIAFADVPVGAIVKVGSSPLPDGSRLAGEIEIEDDLGGSNLTFNLKFQGTITAIDLGTQTVTVGSKVVKTNAATHFEDEDSNPILFSALALGQFVEVKANTQPDDSILAVEIQQETPEGAENHDTELRGIVEAIDLGLGTLTVSKVNITTNGSTVFLDLFNAPTTFSTFALGGLVEVEGLLQVDGSVLATKLKHEDNVTNGVADDVRLYGTLETLDVGLGTMTVVGQAVTTNVSTAFLSSAGIAITIGDFSLGQLVEIEGVLQQDGSVLATRVQKEDGAPVAGRSSAIVYGPTTGVNVGGSTISLRGKTVVVNGSTILRDRYGSTVTLSALRTGDYVGVSGNGQAGGNILATTATRDDQFFAFPAAPPPSAVSDWISYE